MITTYIRRIAAIAAAVIVSAGSLLYAQPKKSVSILGDSYSTFENFIEPNTNEMCYFVKSHPNRTEATDLKQTF